MKSSHQISRTRQFARASALVQSQIRKVSEGRGFAVSRIVTHWSEIAGDEIAEISTPTNISFGRSEFGATLTLLTSGPHAPMLEMHKEKIRDKVNACYGYRAISRIRITQTAPTGFSEGRAQFRPAMKVRKQLDSDALSAAEKLSTGVKDNDLRRALNVFGANILTRHKS